MAKSMNGSKRTRRIQMMVSILIIVYIVLWSPYHIYTILGKCALLYEIRYNGSYSIDLDITGALIRIQYEYNTLTQC